jgi:hypothetical protein
MLTACAVPGKRKSADICAAFIAGAPKSAEGRVFFGVTEGNIKEWKHALGGSEPWFYGDNSYFDAVRGLQYRVTKNRIQHDGEGDTDGKRFARLGIPIGPARLLAEDSYVLCVPQSEPFMRLVIEYRGDWIEDMKAGLRLQGPFRTRQWSSDKLAIQRTLPQDLEHARMVLTHSSAAAVSAVLVGIPVLVSPYSCAFRQATVNDKAERRRWAGVLADNQFDISELRSGHAWRTLHA